MSGPLVRVENAKEESVTARTTSSLKRLRNEIDQTLAKRKHAKKMEKKYETSSYDQLMSWGVTTSNHTSVRIRCFTEAVKRKPNCPWAHMWLAHLCPEVYPYTQEEFDSHLEQRVRRSGERVVMRTEYFLMVHDKGRRLGNPITKGVVLDKELIMIFKTCLNGWSGYPYRLSCQDETNPVGAKYWAQFATRKCGANEYAIMISYRNAYPQYTIDNAFASATLSDPMVLEYYMRHMRHTDRSFLGAYRAVSLMESKQTMATVPLLRQVILCTYTKEAGDIEMDNILMLCNASKSDRSTAMRILEQVDEDTEKLESDFEPDDDNDTKNSESDGDDDKESLKASSEEEEDLGESESDPPTVAAKEINDADEEIDDETGVITMQKIGNDDD